MATSKKQSKDTPTPQYNPFYIALNGITSLFSNALSVGIVVLLISAIGSFTATIGRGDTADSKEVERAFNEFTSLEPSQLAVIGVLILVIVAFGLVVGTMLHGIQSYTAMKLAKGQKTTIGEAFNTVLGQFGGYFILYIWMNLKIALWTLLLIVPGIIAYYRYSFAGVLFFDKDLKHEHAIKESNRLTKGGLMTLFASHALFNIITLGYIDRIISLASISELYREYTSLDAAGKPKPGIHWLSWLTLALPFILLLMLISFTILLAVVIGLTGGALLK